MSYVFSTGGSENESYLSSQLHANSVRGRPPLAAFDARQEYTHRRIQSMRRPGSSPLTSAHHRSSSPRSLKRRNKLMLVGTSATGEGRQSTVHPQSQLLEQPSIEKELIINAAYTNPTSNALRRRVSSAPRMARRESRFGRAADHPSTVAMLINKIENGEFHPSRYPDEEFEDMDGVPIGDLVHDGTVYSANELEKSSIMSMSTIDLPRASLESPSLVHEVDHNKGLFYDLWLSSRADNVKDLDPLNLNLICTLQSSLAQLRPEIAALDSNRQTCQDNEDSNGLAIEKGIGDAGWTVDRVSTAKYAATTALGALDVLIAEVGQRLPVLGDLRDLLLPLVFHSQHVASGKGTDEQQEQELVRHPISPTRAAEEFQATTLAERYSQYLTFAEKWIATHAQLEKITRSYDKLTESFHDMNDELQTTTAALEEKTFALERFSKDQKLLETVTSEAKAQLLSKDKEIDELKKRLQSETEEKKSMQKKMKSLDSEKENIQSSLTAQNLKVKELETKAIESAKTIDKAKSEANELKKARRELKQENDNVIETNKRLTMTLNSERARNRQQLTSISGKLMEDLKDFVDVTSIDPTSERELRPEDDLGRVYLLILAIADRVNRGRKDCQAQLIDWQERHASLNKDFDKYKRDSAALLAEKEAEFKSSLQATEKSCAEITDTLRKAGVKKEMEKVMLSSRLGTSKQEVSFLRKELQDQQQQYEEKLFAQEELLSQWRERSRMQGSDLRLFQQLLRERAAACDKEAQLSQQCKELSTQLYQAINDHSTLSATLAKQVDDMKQQLLDQQSAADERVAEIQASMERERERHREFQTRLEMRSEEIELRLTIDRQTQVSKLEQRCQHLEDKLLEMKEAAKTLSEQPLVAISSIVATTETPLSVEHPAPAEPTVRSRASVSLSSSVRLQALLQSGLPQREAESQTDPVMVESIEQFEAKQLLEQRQRFLEKQQEEERQRLEEVQRRADHLSQQALKDATLFDENYKPVETSHFGSTTAWNYLAERLKEERGKFQSLMLFLNKEKKKIHSDMQKFSRMIEDLKQKLPLHIQQHAQEISRINLTQLINTEITRRVSVFHSSFMNQSGGANNPMTIMTALSKLQDGSRQSFVGSDRNNSLLIISDNSCESIPNNEDQNVSGLRSSASLPEVSIPTDVSKPDVQAISTDDTVAVDSAGTHGLSATSSVPPDLVTDLRVDTSVQPLITRSLSRSPTSAAENDLNITALDAKELIRVGRSLSKMLNIPLAPVLQSDIVVSPAGVNSVGGLARQSIAEMDEEVDCDDKSSVKSRVTIEYDLSPSQKKRRNSVLESRKPRNRATQTTADLESQPVPGSASVASFDSSHDDDIRSQSLENTAFNSSSPKAGDFASRLRDNVAKSCIPSPRYDLELASQPFIGYVRRNEKQLARQCAMMQVALRESRALFDRVSHLVDTRMTALFTMNTELSEARIRQRAQAREDAHTWKEQQRLAHRKAKKAKRIAFQEESQADLPVDISNRLSLQLPETLEATRIPLTAAVAEIENESDTVRVIRVRSLREMFGELKSIRETLRESGWLYDASQFAATLSTNAQRLANDAVDVAAQSRMLSSYKDSLEIEQSKLRDLNFEIDELEEHLAKNPNINLPLIEDKLNEKENHRAECLAVIGAVQELVKELSDRIRSNGDWQAVLFTVDGDVDLELDESPYPIDAQCHILREKISCLRRKFSAKEEEHEIALGSQRKEIEMLHDSLIALQRERDATTDLAHHHHTRESREDSLHRGSGPSVVISEELELRLRSGHRPRSLEVCEQAVNTDPLPDSIQLSEKKWIELQAALRGTTDMMNVLSSVREKQHRSATAGITSNAARAYPHCDFQQLSATLTNRQTPLSVSQSVTELDSDSFINFVRPMSLVPHRSQLRPHSAVSSSASLEHTSLLSNKISQIATKKSKRPWTSSTWRRVETHAANLCKDGAPRLAHSADQARPSVALPPAEDNPLFSEADAVADQFTSSLSRIAISLQRELEAAMLADSEDDDALQSLVRSVPITGQSEPTVDPTVDRRRSFELKTTSFVDSILSEDFNIETNEKQSSAEGQQDAEAVALAGVATDNKLSAPFGALGVGEAVLESEMSVVSASGKFSHDDRSCSTLDNIVSNLAQSSGKLHESTIALPTQDEWNTSILTKQADGSHSKESSTVHITRTPPRSVLHTLPRLASLPQVLKQPHQLVQHSITAHHQHEEHRKNVRAYEELFAAVYSLSLARQQSDLLKYSVTLFEQFKEHHDAAKRAKKQLLSLQQSHHIFEDNQFVDALQQSWADQERETAQSHQLNKRRLLQESTALMKSLNKESRHKSLKTPKFSRSHVGVHISELSLLPGNDTASSSLKRFDENNLREAIARQSMDCSAPEDFTGSALESISRIEGQPNALSTIIRFSDEDGDEVFASTPSVLHTQCETDQDYQRIAAQTHFKSLAHVNIAQFVPHDKSSSGAMASRPFVYSTEEEKVIDPAKHSAKRAQSTHDATLVERENLEKHKATQWYKSLSSARHDS